MAAILDAIFDFEECQQGISGDFLSVILHIFLDLSWKNQLVTKNVQVKTNIIGLYRNYKEMHPTFWNSLTLNKP